MTTRSTTATLHLPQKSTNVRRPEAPPLLQGALRALTAVSPKLTSKVALELFITPRRHRRPAREQTLLAGAQPLRFLSGGQVLHGWSWGEGPAVMLVHGWEGRGAQLGEFVAPLVDAGYRVVTFDAPAHGDSPGRTAVASDLARAVHDLAEWIGGVHAVIAHSMGGIATAVAMQDGLRAERVVLIAPAAHPKEATDMLADILDLPPSVVAQVRHDLAARVGTTWEQVVGARHYDGHSAPLLVFHDWDDKEVGMPTAQNIAQRWAGPSELVRTNGLGHRRILRDATTIQRTVDFIGAPPADTRGPWARFLRFETDFDL